jgi:Uncharacterized conserved protein
MNFVNLAALALIIVGGLNWGLVRLFDINLVATIFGVDAVFTNLIYILVGPAAIWGFMLLKPLSRDHARTPA